MKIKLILILSFICQIGFGQIPLVFHINSNTEIKGGNVIQTEEKLLLGSKNGLRYLKKFNNKNQLVSDERSDLKGKFISRLEYSYDTLSNKKLTFKQTFSRDDGFNINTQKYQYDAEGMLASFTYHLTDGQLQETNRVTCDEFGNPIKIKTYDEIGLVATEVAQYDFEKNEATYQKLDTKGKTVHSGVFIIDYEKQQYQDREGYKYNKKGDLTRTPNSIIKIKYDKYDNWIVIKKYDLKGKRKTLSQAHTRKITYRE